MWRTFLILLMLPASLAIELLCNESGILTNYDTSTSLSHLYNVCHDIGNGALFFVNKYTVSLIWSKKTIFLFDSHSRDSDGCIDGTSVLLKFKSTFELQNYNTQTYLIDLNHQFMHFQMQFVKLITDTITISLIVNTFKNTKIKVHRNNMFGFQEHEKIKKQKRDNDFLSKQNIFSSPEHEEIKKQMRYRDFLRRQNVCGSPIHEEINKQMRGRNFLLRQEIFGSPKHEEIKKKTRDHMSKLMHMVQKGDVEKFIEQISWSI